MLRFVAFTALVCAAFVGVANAQTGRIVTGRIVDAVTSQPLAGAAVQISGTTHGAIADARGDFRIAVPPPVSDSARVRVRVTIIGYQTLETELETEAAGAALGGAAVAPPLVRLTPTVIPIEGAEVASHLAREGRSPTAFSELDRRDIERDHYGQDVPILLSETPGTYAYSDAGNGIGYSYLKIRGFSQRRIAVTINGIPLNDPQSREVFWIDHPDLAASAQTMQVQRGVGTTAYGTTAIGGSVNVETIPFEQSPRLTLEAGGGSFGTQRYSAQAASGLIDEKYAVEARLSRILTDGYREQSWSDLWSYFLGVTRVDQSVVTRLNLYGGPERTHLAYLGVPGDYLSGAITGDEDQDRRFNPLVWQGERDNFFEPHYELLNDWKISPKTSLSSALFYFPGKGYYDEFREDQPLGDYGLASAAVSDLTRRRWAKNVHVGWVPRVRHESGRYALEGGLDLRFHEGRRWGEVLWSEVAAPGQQPNHVYYDYIGRVTNSNAFLRQSWAPSEKLRLTGDLAFHHQRYEMGHDVYTGRSFDETYTFLMPRAGVNLALRDAPGSGLERLEGYASFSLAESEPIFRELYDAESAAGAPPAFANEDANGRLTDPLIDPERVNDWEAGLRARGPWGNASFGGFWMQFEDEIVFNGTLDDVGNPITGNAAASHHAGFEGDARLRLGSAFELFGAFHWAVNEFDEYEEFTGDSTATIDYSGNAIAGFPDRAFHVNATYRRGGGRLEMGADYAGRQYLDNNESVAASIAPWTVANALVGWRVAGWLGMRELDVSLRVSNLFDRHYETAGYVDYPAPLFAPTPVFIPAATRGLFFAVKTTL